MCGARVCGVLGGARVLQRQRSEKGCSGWVLGGGGCGMGGDEIGGKL